MLYELVLVREGPNLVNQLLDVLFGISELHFDLFLDILLDHSFVLEKVVLAHTTVYHQPIQFLIYLHKSLPKRLKTHQVFFALLSDGIQ